MSSRTPLPRLRMFAGPNGSGKTTVQGDIASQFPAGFLGVLVNPDDLEANIRSSGRLDLGTFSISATDAEVREAFTASSFLQRLGLAEAAAVLRCDGRVIDFGGLTINSYYASVLADFLRRRLLRSATPFSFETVMSEPGKVSFLREAQSVGFRTYLYYVATEDPEINVTRVAFRVTQGGHDVPKEKIVTRYRRSLELLRDAIRYADRAYFFDTSESTSLFIGESASGARPKVHCDRLPTWFRTFVLDKF